MLSAASIKDINTTIFSILDMHPSTFHHIMAPPSAPQWFTSQSGTATIPPGFTPALQHTSFHQQQQAGFGPTHFVQPMASGPQSHTPNSQWMPGPASTQAAAMFAPQGHTMHQPPLTQPPAPIFPRPQQISGAPTKTTTAVQPIRAATQQKTCKASQVQNTTSLLPRLYKTITSAVKKTQKQPIQTSSPPHGLPTPEPFPTPCRVARLLRRPRTPAEFAPGTSK